MKFTTHTTLPRITKALAATVDANAPKRIMAIMEGSIAEVFRSQGQALGHSWAPLAASTLKRRRAGPSTRRQRAQILVDTGTLRQSVTSGGGGGAYRSQSMREVVVGTKIPYAAAHQFGPKRNLPARPFMGLTQDARDRIRKMVRHEVIVARMQP